MERAGSGPGGEPAGNLGPAVARGAAAGDQRDVTAGQLDVFLLTARDGVEQRVDALGRRDVVLLSADDEDGARDVLETHGPAAHDELAALEPVLLIEAAHPLAEELPRTCDGARR